jgi:predicted nucleotidyltransferase
LQRSIHCALRHVRNLDDTQHEPHAASIQTSGFFIMTHQDNDALTTFICNGKPITISNNLYHDLAHEADFELGISKISAEFEELIIQRQRLTL